MSLLLTHVNVRWVSSEAIMGEEGGTDLDVFVTIRHTATAMVW